MWMDHFWKQAILHLSSARKAVKNIKCSRFTAIVFAPAIASQLNTVCVCRDSWQLKSLYAASASTQHTHTVCVCVELMLELRYKLLSCHDSQSVSHVTERKLYLHCTEQHSTMSITSVTEAKLANKPPLEEGKSLRE